MLTKLKEKFSSLERTDPLRKRILTIVPEVWSVNKIAKEFNCSWRLAKISKDLRASGGVLANTIATAGNSLPDETVQKVKDFYMNGINSRVMPGKRDVVSVKSETGRCLEQKRLLLLDLRELYKFYKKANLNFL